MKNTLDLNIMEEFSNLEYFVVKASVNSPEFWKEWQEKYSRALVSRIAVKKTSKKPEGSHTRRSKGIRPCWKFMRI